MIAIAQAPCKSDRIHLVQWIIEHYVSMPIGIKGQGIGRLTIYGHKQESTIVSAAHPQVQARTTKGYCE